MRTAMAGKELKRESLRIRVHVMRKGSTYLDGVIALEELYPKSVSRTRMMDAPCGQVQINCLCGGVLYAKVT